MTATSTCSSTRLGDPMALFVNDGTGHFTDEATERGLGFGDANNVAFADYDNDGDADVLVVRDGSDRCSPTTAAGTSPTCRPPPASATTTGGAWTRRGPTTTVTVCSTST